MVSLMKNLTKTRLNKKHETLTNGIVHAGFSGFQAFVARKKSRCILIGNRLVIPHDTIPSTVRVALSALLNLMVFALDSDIIDLNKN